MIVYPIENAVFEASVAFARYEDREHVVEKEGSCKPSVRTYGACEGRHGPHHYAAARFHSVRLTLSIFTLPVLSEMSTQDCRGNLSSVQQFLRLPSTHVRLPEVGAVRLNRRAEFGCAWLVSGLSRDRDAHQWVRPRAILQTRAGVSGTRR